MVQLLIVSLATLAVTLAAPGFADLSSEFLSGLSLGQKEKPQGKPIDTLQADDRFKIHLRESEIAKKYTEEKENKVKDVNVGTTFGDQRSGVKTDGNLNDKATLVPSLGMSSDSKTKISRNRGSIKYATKTTTSTETNNVGKIELSLIDRGNARHRVGGSSLTETKNAEFVNKLKLNSKTSMSNNRITSRYSNLADGSAQVEFGLTDTAGFGNIILDNNAKSNLANLALPGTANKKVSETINSRINIAAKNLENFKDGSEGQEKQAYFGRNLENEANNEYFNTNNETINIGSSKSSDLKNSGENLSHVVQSFIGKTEEIANIDLTTGIIGSDIVKINEKEKDKADTTFVTHEGDVEIVKKNDSINVDSQQENADSSKPQSFDENLRISAKQSFIDKYKDIVNGELTTGVIDPSILKIGEREKGKTGTNVMSHRGDVQFGKRFDSINVDSKPTNTNSSRMQSSDKNLSFGQKKKKNVGLGISDDNKVRSKFENKVTQIDVDTATSSKLNRGIKQGLKASDRVDSSISTVMKKSEALKGFESDKVKSQNITGTIVNYDFSKINGVNARIKDRGNTRYRNRESDTANERKSNKKISSYVESTENSATLNVGEENKQKNHTSFGWSFGNKSVEKQGIKSSDIEVYSQSENKGTGISSTGTNFVKSESLGATQTTTVNASYGLGGEVSIGFKNNDTLKVVEADNDKVYTGFNLSSKNVDVANQESFNIREQTADKTENQFGWSFEKRAGVFGINFANISVGNKNGNFGSGASSTLSNASKNSLGIKKSEKVELSLSDDVKIGTKFDSKMNQVVNDTVIYSNLNQDVKQSLDASNVVDSDINTLLKESENSKVLDTDNVKTQNSKGTILENNHNKIKDIINTNRGNNRYRSEGNLYDTVNNVYSKDGMAIQFESKKKLNEKNLDISSSRIKVEATNKSDNSATFNVVKEKNKNTAAKLEIKSGNTNLYNQYINKGISSSGTNYSENGSLGTKQSTSINASYALAGKINFGLLKTESYKTVEPKKDEAKTAFDLNFESQGIANHDSFNTEGKTIQKTPNDYSSGIRHRTGVKFGINSDMINVNNKNENVRSSISNESLSLGVKQSLSGEPINETVGSVSTLVKHSETLKFSTKDKIETQNNTDVIITNNFGKIEDKTNNSFSAGLENRENTENRSRGSDYAAANDAELRSGTVPQFSQDRKLNHLPDIGSARVKIGITNNFGNSATLNDEEKKEGKFHTSFAENLENESAAKLRIKSGGINVHNQNKVEESGLTISGSNYGETGGFGEKQSTIGYFSGTLGGEISFGLKNTQSPNFVELEKNEARGAFDLNAKNVPVPNHKSFSSGGKTTEKTQNNFGWSFGNGDGIKFEINSNNNIKKNNRNVGSDISRALLNSGENGVSLKQSLSDMLSDGADSGANNEREHSDDRKINRGNTIYRNRGGNSVRKESISNAQFYNINSSRVNVGVAEKSNNSANFNIREEKIEKNNTSIDWSFENRNTNLGIKSGDVDIYIQNKHDGRRIGENLSLGVQKSFNETESSKIKATLQSSKQLNAGGEEEKNQSNFGWSLRNETKLRIKSSNIDANSLNRNVYSSVSRQGHGSDINLSLGVRQSVTGKESNTVESVSNTELKKSGRLKLIEEEKDKSKNSLNLSAGNGAGTKAHTKFGSITVGIKNENEGNGLAGVELSSGENLSHSTKQVVIAKSNEDGPQQSIVLSAGGEKDKTYSGFDWSFEKGASLKPGINLRDVDANNKNKIVDPIVSSQELSSDINLDVKPNLSGRTSKTAENNFESGFKNTEDLKVVNEDKNKTNISINLNVRNGASTKGDVKFEEEKLNSNSNIKMTSTGDKINLGHTASLGFDKISGLDDAAISGKKTLSFIDFENGKVADFTEKHDIERNPIVSNVDLSKNKTDLVVTVGQYYNTVGSGISFKKGDNLKIGLEESSITLTVTANSMLRPNTTTNTSAGGVPSTEVPEIDQGTSNSVTSKQGSDCDKNVEKVIVNVNFENNPTDSDNASHRYNIINIIFNVNETLPFLETKGRGEKMEPTSSSQSQLNNLIFGNVLDLRNKTTRLDKMSPEGNDNKKIMTIFL